MMHGRKNIKLINLIIFSGLNFKKTRNLYVIDGLIKSHFLLSSASVASNRDSAMLPSSP